MGNCLDVPPKVDDFVSSKGHSVVGGEKGGKTKQDSNPRTALGGVDDGVQDGYAKVIWEDGRRSAGMGPPEVEKKTAKGERRGRWQWRQSLGPFLKRRMNNACSMHGQNLLL
ncbi:hypothetical protein CsSME_00053496 [Camellia sinensis var. sinensis]